MNIEMLRKLLAENTLSVLFTKKNGSFREMFCTTASSVLGPYEPSSKEPSPSLVTVWDLEADDWRSFNFSSLISVRDSDGNLLYDKRMAES